MQLTLTLLKRKFPKGNIWRGKYRVVRDVNNLDVAITRNNLEIEERNMFYLRHPYLSAAEWHGMGDYLGLTKNWFHHWQEKKRIKFKRTAAPRTLRANFESLNVNDKWE